MLRQQLLGRRKDMGVFRRQYPDGRLSKDWYIDYRANGKRYKRRIGPNKKLAEQVLMDIEVKKAKGEYLGVHDVKKITVADFLNEYLTWASVNKGANTYALNRFCADRLRETFTGYLSGITAKQVEEYKVQRRKTVSPATVNRELALLKHVCTKAMKWGYLKTNPLKPVKFLKEPLGRLRYLTREEVDALVAACPLHLKPIVVVAMHTGMRKSEVLGLKWQDTDFATKTIIVRQTKNNEPNVVPMNQTLLEEFQHLPRHLHSDYVFCNAAGQAYDEV
jgi:integrase